MMSSTPNFLIASLNVEGIRRNDEFVKLLMREKKLDVICLQETWLCEQDTLTLETLCNEFSFRFCAKAGVDCTENVVAGRVPGGVAIFYKQSLDHVVKIVNVQNRRLCAMTIHVNDSVLLLINAYLPVDPQCNVSNDEYEDALNDVGLLIQSVPWDNVILCGDLNTDMRRTNMQTQSLTDFIERNNLCVGWQSAYASPSHTYVNVHLNHTSCIDHFIMNERLFDAIVEMKTYLDPLNMSSHRPVLLCLETQLTEQLEAPSAGQTASANWAKAQSFHKELYAEQLTHLLNAMDVDQSLLNCEDDNCSLISHRDSIERLCDGIIECCISAERTCIPQKGTSRANPIPGWNDHVEGHRQTALFWHEMWLQAGQPEAGPVLDVMKHTRRVYHYAIRFCKKK